MREHAVRRLPVLEDGQVTGIVSLGDLAIPDGPDLGFDELPAPYCGRLTRPGRHGDEITVGGITVPITHPDKVLFPRTESPRRTWPGTTPMSPAGCCPG